MAKIEAIGERVYRCRVCGYEAKSGAGLTGHVQLAHGERTSGTKELAEIGRELAALHQDVNSHLIKFNSQALMDQLRELTNEYRELNSHLRALRASREQPPAVQSGNTRPQAVIRAVPVPPTSPPAVAPPSSFGESLLKLLVVGMAFYGAYTLLGGSQTGPNS